MAHAHRSRLLTLVRCGETIWERDGRLHGSTSLPLSDAGRAQVREWVGGLSERRISTVCSAPDEASIESAAIVAKVVRARKKVIDDLAEPALGLLEGLHEREFEERFPKRFRQWEDDPLSVAAPEGETALDAQRRIASAVFRLIRRSRAEETAFVLRPFALGVVRCGLCGFPGTRLRDLVRNRPPVERYLLARELIDDWLAAVQTSAASA